MSKIAVRHLVAKRQKNGAVLYYWQPSKALRLAGFKPQRLARATNDPLDAAREAEAINRDVDRWRKGDTGPRIKHETLPWLIRLYKADPRYLDRRPATRKNYAWAMRQIEAWSRRASDPPLASLRRRICREWYLSLREQGSDARAALVMSVLTLLLQFAVDEEIITTNPARNLRLRTPKPRAAVWRPEDVEALCKAALKAGRPSIALAVRLAAGLGQREGDILRLAWSQYAGGAFRIRQAKTGAFIEVPAGEALREELAVAPRRGPVILINENTRRPWRSDTFSHVFADIRAAAKLAHLQFRDLRRTAVVQLAEAGCTVPEIASITGHSIDRSAAIVEVYLPRNSTMARSAVTKLEEYKKRTKLEAGD